MFYSIIENKAYKRWVKINVREKILPGLENFTQDQLFFINFAQVRCSKYRNEALVTRIVSGVHSPGEFR